MTTFATDQVLRRGIEKAAKSFKKHCTTHNRTPDTANTLHWDVVKKDTFLTGIYLSTVHRVLVDVGQIANRKSRSVPSYQVL